MTFEKLHNLCNGIVEQAAKDYRKALSGARVEHKAPEKVIAECEQFFRSKWFSLLTNVDGEYLITEMRKEFAYKR